MLEIKDMGPMLQVQDMGPLQEDDILNKEDLVDSDAWYYRQKRWDRCMKFKLIICFAKFILDVINFYLIFDQQIVEVKGQVFGILLLYGLNDVWVIIVNTMQQEQNVMDSIHDNNCFKGFPKVYSDNWLKHAKLELRIFHNQNIFIIISTYIHVFVSIGLMVLSIDQYENIKSSILGLLHFYLTIFGILISIIFPLMLIVVYYVVIMTYVGVCLVFEILFFVLVLTSSIVFSPCLCAYFKFSQKDKDGYTKIHLRVRQSLYGAECAICMEEFLINQKVIFFPCHGSHKFHYSCGRNWWDKKRNCPLCRTEFELLDINKFVIFNNVEKDTAKKEYSEKEMQIQNIFWRYFKRKVITRFRKMLKNLKHVFTAQIGLIYVILLTINYIGNI